MTNQKTSKWFTHDVDALEDPKIMLLVHQFGLEAYALYWMLLERLCKQPEYKLPFILIDSISRNAGVSKEKIEAIITKFGLFEIDEKDFFFSPSLIRRMQGFENRTRINRQNALNRWDAERRKDAEMNAIAEQSQSNRNAIAEQSQCNGNAIIKDNIIKDNIIKHNITEENKNTDKSESNSDSDLSFKFSDEIIKVYEWIINSKTRNGEPIFPGKFIPGSKSQKERWLTCINDLIRLDKYSAAELIEIIRFAREDPFWNKNFFSILKLRKKDKEGVRYIDKFSELMKAKKPAGNLYKVRNYSPGQTF